MCLLVYLFLYTHKPDETECFSNQGKIHVRAIHIHITYMHLYINVCVYIYVCIYICAHMYRYLYPCSHTRAPTDISSSDKGSAQRKHELCRYESSESLNNRIGAIYQILL